MRGEAAGGQGIPFRRCPVRCSREGVEVSGVRKLGVVLGETLGVSPSLVRLPCPQRCNSAAALPGLMSVLGQCLGVLDGRFCGGVVAV